MQGSQSGAARITPCGLDDSLTRVVRLAAQVSGDRIPVRDEDGRLLGVVTLSDIWTAVALRQLPLGELRVREVVRFADTPDKRRRSTERHA